MPTTGSPINLILTLEPLEAVDLASVDESARLLLADLRESEGTVTAELLVGDSGPVGAKSPEAITIGMLALAVLPTMLPRLVQALQAWSLRWRDYRVRIKKQVGDQSFELEYAPSRTSSEELQRLIDLVAHALPDHPAPAEVQLEPQAGPPIAEPT